MGFSSALQGRAAHEALLARQDAELRLLETMKRCLLQKAKCDKEYSIALAAVTQQGQKIDRVDELQGSHITKAWRTFMDQIEQTGKQFKSNAELLESVCQEKLAQLYQEKRKARKAYQEEHSRISTQFSQLTEEVNRKKSEYQKHMEYYKLLRSRFEEHYIKSGRGGRKLDEVRDKYQKACRKLHLAHNEYVLIINEAIEVEKDFRTCLLPGLLEHQQSLQEGYIQSWRNIIQEAAQCGDLTSEKFREITKHIESIIQNVNPAEEYREFTERHKTTPTAPIQFQFDDTLIEDSLGKLQPNTLTVDNLTVDWLRTRLNELETSVKDCQDKQNKLAIETGATTTPTLSISNGGLNGINGKDGNKHSKDLNALRCQERQMLKLAEIIKTALNEVGCEELPSGCDDISVGQNFIENNVGTDQSNSATTSSYIFQKGAEVMSMIKAPFKRKSCPPTTPERTPRSRRHKSPDPSVSLGSSVNSLASNPKNSFAKTDSNLYVDVDNVETNSLILNCENNNSNNFIINNFNTAHNDDDDDDDEDNDDVDNNGKCELLQNDNDCTEKNNCSGDSKIGDSKNNLLLYSEMPNDDIKSSIDAHLDSIDKINKKLDEKMLEDIMNEDKKLVLSSNDDISILNKTINEKDNIGPSNASAKSIKNKIKQKIKLGSATFTSNSNSEKNKLIDPKSKDEIIENIISQEIDGKSNNSNAIDCIGVEQNLENEIKDLEKLIEDTDKEIKKKSSKKKRKKKKNGNSSKLIEDSTLKDDDDSIDTTENEFKSEKKSKSFSNRSMNAILTSLRELKNYKGSAIESTKLTNVESIDSEIIVSPNTEENVTSEILHSNKDTENLLNDDNNLNNSPKIINETISLTTQTNILNNNIVDELEEQFDSEINSPLDSDTKEIINQSTSSSNNNVAPINITTPITKSRTTKFKETLKKKLNFNQKSSSSNSKKFFCKKCAKPNRKIHPSHTVLDFEREFHTDKLFKFDNNDFCICDDLDDDCITIKNHDYNSPESMTISTNRPLSAEDWFHGVLPREEVVRLLRNEGDFLVRQTTRNDESQIVLSVCWNGHKHFIVQTTAEGHYRFEGPAFPSIQELILHQYQSELPVTGRSGAILKKPVPRETWELSNDDVIPKDKIGRGNFGDVYKAILKSSKMEVAVKTCRMTLPEEQKRKFLQEGRILKQYDHPNIVKLIGICVQKQPIMIVMELVGGGSLLNFLRKNASTLTVKQLMGMCRDAAAGMRYLESKNCIHRDLAARNCLIGYENIVKISDFGMSREEEEYIVSDGMKQIPIKWTAPEALNFGKYTSLCDVWSYAVLMWEIFSKGDTPYSGMSNSRARERIDTGYRMPAPELTPPEMYRLMLKCWSYEAESRPHFDEIFTVVDALIIRDT